MRGQKSGCEKNSKSAEFFRSSWELFIFITLPYARLPSMFLYTKMNLMKSIKCCIHLGAIFTVGENGCPCPPESRQIYMINLVNCIVKAQTSNIQMPPRLEQIFGKVFFEFVASSSRQISLL